MTRDLELASDERDLALWQGADEVAARCDAALQTVQGYWAFDSRIGIRGLDRLLDKPYAPDLWRAEAARVLRTVPGITQVLSVVIDFDRPRRAATIRWSAMTAAGPTQGLVHID